MMKVITLKALLLRRSYYFYFTLLISILSMLTQAWSQEEQRRIAVLDFKNEANLTSFEISALTGIVRQNASQLSGYIVMTKENIKTLLPPDKKLEDCISTCEVETGQMLGASFIVTGEVGRVEGLLQLSIRIFNTAQGKLLDQQVLTSDNVLGLQKKLGEAAQTLLQRVSGVAIANDSASGGTVYLTFSPPDLQLEINDDPLPRSNLKAKGDGYLLMLKPGKYTIAGRARGYMTQRETFVLNEGAVIDIKLNLNQALKKDNSCNPKDKSCRGQIQVFTKPAGSRLWVDSVQTPHITQPSRRDPSLGTYTLSLPPGEHIIEARLNRYIPAKTKVLIIRDDINFDLKQTPLQLQPNFGDLQISSTPSGATVFLDDKLVGTTPYTGKDIDAGPHKIRVFLEGYHTKSEIAVVERKTMSRESYILKPTFSDISVSVTAEGNALSGAMVLLDQKMIGKTSSSGIISLGKVEAGERQLQISHPLYQAYIKPIVVTEGKKEQLKINLEPAYAYLTVTLKDSVDAMVKVDGETVGQAPLTNLKVATGNSVLEVVPIQANLYKTYKTKLALTIKEKKTILADCRPLIGKLTIMSNPPEADIYVDGKMKGQSPLKLQLTQGTHLIEARYPNYSSNKTEVTIADGETKETRLELSHDPILEITCLPNGNLFVNNKLIGSSPKEVTRKPGTYTVRCENGGLTTSKKVTLSTGRVKVELRLLSKALKAQANLRKTKLKKAGWLGLSTLIMAGISAGSWVLYQSKLSERDEKLNDLNTAAWTLDYEAKTLNQVSIGLSATTAMLGMWSLYELLTRPPEPKLNEQATTKGSLADIIAQTAFEANQAANNGLTTNLSICEKEKNLLNDTTYLNASIGVMKQPACLKLWEPKRIKFNLTKNLRGAAWQVITTHKKVKFYRDKSSLSSKRGGRAPQGQGNCSFPPYVVKASYSRNDQTALYLAKAERQTSHKQTDAKNCGWVMIDDLIVDTIPIRDSYDIDQKAFLVYNWWTIKNLDTEGIKKLSLLYSYPSRRSVSLDKLSNGLIAYIYKSLIVGKERWYYIITDSSIEGDRMGRATSGWIPASSVQRWDTSVAFYPSPKRRRNNAVVYRDESAARQEISSEIVVPDHGKKVARPVEERPFLVLPVRESSRRRRRACADCRMVAYTIMSHQIEYRNYIYEMGIRDNLSKSKIEERLAVFKHLRLPIMSDGYIRHDERFNALILFSKFDLSDYISTIAEIAEYGDKVSIIKALKKTCEQLSRSSNVTSGSCNNMRDAINNSGDYDLWKYPAEEILKKLKDKRFLNPILDKSQKILKKLKGLNRNQRAWFKIGDQEYIWVKQTELL